MITTVVVDFLSLFYSRLWIYHRKTQIIHVFRLVYSFIVLLFALFLLFFFSRCVLLLFQSFIFVSMWRHKTTENIIIWVYDLSKFANIQPYLLVCLAVMVFRLTFNSGNVTFCCKLLHLGENRRLIETLFLKIRRNDFCSVRN